MFRHQSYVWQNFGFQVVGQNVVGESNCRILKNVISKGRSE